MQKINFFLAFAFFCLSFSNLFFFNYLKTSVNKLKCEAINVFTTDASGALFFKVDQLAFYNILVIFEILDIPDHLSTVNKVHYEVVGTGGNFSRRALMEVKKQYYIHSLHDCVLTTFPATYFTVINASHEKIKKKFYQLLTTNMFILSLFFFLSMIIIAKTTS